MTSTALVGLLCTWVVSWPLWSNVSSVSGVALWVNCHGTATAGWWGSHGWESRTIDPPSIIHTSKQSLRNALCNTWFQFNIAWSLNFIKFMFWYFTNDVSLRICGFYVRRVSLSPGTYVHMCCTTTLWEETLSATVLQLQLQYYNRTSMEQSQIIDIV